MKEILLAVGCYLLLTASVFGQSPYHQRDSLKGLSGVYVLVDMGDSKVEGGILTEEQIHTDVEIRLRKAGIKVLRIEELKHAVGTPILQVNLAIKRIEEIKRTLGSDLYPFSVLVGVHQSVISKVIPNLTIFGATWSESGLGVAGKANLRLVREMVADKVDLLINDYLTMNPK